MTRAEDLIEPEGYVELASGLVVPASAAPAPRPKALDLFCGCGGFSLGMIEGGFEVVGAVDNEPWAALTYLTNLGTYPVSVHFVAREDRRRFEKAVAKELKHAEKKGLREVMRHVSGGNRPAGRPGVSHFWLGDARQLRGKDMLRELGLEAGELDCVFGGPPCQGYSYIGKRQVHDPRNSLVFEFARLVCELRPKTVVMENVPGIIDMVTSDGLPVVDAFCRVLEDGGFGTLDALKRSLLASSGAGTLMRGNGKPLRRKDLATSKPGKKRAPGPTQVSLFEETAP